MKSRRPSSSRRCAILVAIGLSSTSCSPQSTDDRTPWLVFGIVDFVIPTPDGDVPLSSKQRKVPAIWNLTTLLDRPVAVFGWWATWPAEAVNGIIVSDRFDSGLERMHIFDVAPTLAYGLGMSVARNADGQVREELFKEDFRRRTPRRHVSSWGAVETTAVTRLESDEEMLEELRALGYLG